MSIPPALRDDLLAYLLCTSPDRARLIAELIERNPGLANLLMDLEADDDLRAKLEMNYSAEQAAAKRPDLYRPNRLGDAVSGLLRPVPELHADLENSEHAAGTFARLSSRTGPLSSLASTSCGMVVVICASVSTAMGRSRSTEDRQQRERQDHHAEDGERDKRRSALRATLPMGDGAGIMSRSSK